MTVTIVIATCNSSRTLTRCLESVLQQTYPKDKIDIILADGGSRDNTKTIGKHFGAKIISVDPKKQNAEYNKGVGLQHAKGDVVLFLDHDNIMPHRAWLSALLYPFKNNPTLVGCEPLRFQYDRNMTVLDRYFALTGGSDPVVYYLGKNSHLSWASDVFNLLGTAKDRGTYYEVTYNRQFLPALGGNGAAIRREYLKKYALSDPEHFIHTDVVFDIINHGFTTYAFIKDTIIHLTNNRIIPFLRRRKYFIEQYQFTNKSIRRYAIYDTKKDIGKLLYFILISLTVVVPFFDAWRGYRKIRDPAWFLHPFLCFMYMCIYGYAVIERRVRNVSLV